MIKFVVLGYHSSFDIDHVMNSSIKKRKPHQQTKRLALVGCRPARCSTRHVHTLTTFVAVRANTHRCRTHNVFAVHVCSHSCRCVRLFTPFPICARAHTVAVMCACLHRCRADRRTHIIATCARVKVFTVVDMGTCLHHCRCLRMFTPLPHARIRTDFSLCARAHTGL